jgi:predicted O-methyltransferase YrrM
MVNVLYESVGRMASRSTQNLAQMTYDDYALGPIGAADREVLVAVAKYYNQPSVLEYGSADGHSAQAWVDGGAEIVHCVDLRLCSGMAGVAGNNADRVTFFCTDQVGFQPPRSYDIIFIDASHHLQTNIATLDIAGRALLPGGCVIVHDTGKWPAQAMQEAHRAFGGTTDADGGKWHQPDEVAFVQWMQGQGWQCVTLSSSTALRHGLTLCQPRRPVKGGK